MPLVGEGVMKEEKFLHTREPPHRRAKGELWSLRVHLPLSGSSEGKTQRKFTAKTTATNQQPFSQASAQTRGWGHPSRVKRLASLCLYQRAEVARGSNQDPRERLGAAGREDMLRRLL